jgi:hypothetical protein
MVIYLHYLADHSNGIGPGLGSGKWILGRHFIAVFWPGSSLPNPIGAGEEYGYPKIIRPSMTTFRSITGVFEKSFIGAALTGEKG